MSHAGAEAWQGGWRRPRESAGADSDPARPANRPPRPPSPLKRPPTPGFIPEPPPARRRYRSQQPSIKNAAAPWMDRISEIFSLHAGWMMLIAAASLACLGIVAIQTNHPLYGATQFKWLGLSVIALAVCCLPSPRFIGSLAYLLAAVAGLLLVILVIPGIPAWIAPVRNNARSWLNLQVMMFQPSELAKIAFVLALAWHLRYRDHYRTFWGLMKPFALMLLPVLLILKQPDLGTAILFVPTVFAMMLAAGARLTHLGGLAAAAILFVAINIAAIFVLPDQAQLLRGYQRERILATISQMQGDTRYIDHIGYQQNKAVTLIGSGQTFGYGADRARVIIQHNKVPEDHNDMIFGAVVNRWGLVGAAAVLGLYGLLGAAMLVAAARSKDPFARLCIVGFAALIFTQMTINIGMNIGLLPVIGITLPFISYGGSSLLMTFVMIGLAFNFASRPPSRLSRPSFEFADDL